MTYYVAYNHLDDTILDISSGTEPVPVKEYVETFKDIIIPDKIIENNGFRVSKRLLHMDYLLSSFNL